MVEKKNGPSNHLKGMRKLDLEIVEAIRRNFKGGNGLQVSKIHRIIMKKGYDVTYASVRNVALEITWKHSL